MTRVWNITDGGQEGVKPHNRMVLGKSLKPGQYVQVDESRLAGATKIRQDESAKLLYIGKQPPAWYAQKKKPPRATVEGRRVVDGRTVGKKVTVVPGHAVTAMSQPSAPKPVEEAPAILEGEPVQEEVKEEAPAEETPVEEEEFTSFGGRRRKRK